MILRVFFSNENDVSLHVARIPNAMEVSPKTLRQMAIDLPLTAELLPSQFGFDVVGYGCTSGATLIGEEEVGNLIRDIHPKVATTNPITATKAALSALGATKIALLTPYPVGVGIFSSLEKASKQLVQFDEQCDPDPRHTEQLLKIFEIYSDAISQTAEIGRRLNSVET